MPTVPTPLTAPCPVVPPLLVVRAPLDGVVARCDTAGPFAVLVVDTRLDPVRVEELERQARARLVGDLAGCPDVVDVPGVLRHPQLRLVPGGAA